MIIRDFLPLPFGIVGGRQVGICGVTEESTLNPLEDVFKPLELHVLAGMAEDDDDVVNTEAETDDERLADLSVRFVKDSVAVEGVLLCTPISGTLLMIHCCLGLAAEVVCILVSPGQLD